MLTILVDTLISCPKRHYLKSFIVLGDRLSISRARQCSVMYCFFPLLISLVPHLAPALAEVDNLNLTMSAIAHPQTGRHGEAPGTSTKTVMIQSWTKEVSRQSKQQTDSRLGNEEAAIEAYVRAKMALLNQKSR